MDNFAVVCATGSFRDALDGDPVTHFDHRWTEGGVDVVAGFTGAHMLHVAIAACVLNDVYREAARLGVPLHGVRVDAEGGFAEDWSSTGVSYRVELDSAADDEALTELLVVVDQVAEIPRALRAGTSVVRTD